MVMVKAQQLRACVVCLYLIEQEVIDPIGEVVNGCRIACCWEYSGEITGEHCEKCLHFANIHAYLWKGGNEHVKKAVETHKKAHPNAGTGPGKGKNRTGAPKEALAPKQLELDPDKTIVI